MRTRQSRGFTLIEMIVVSAILVIFASLVVPRVVNYRDGAIQRDAIPSFKRLLNYAREAAISNKTTVIVSYDSSLKQFTAKQDTDADQNAPTTSSNSSSQNASGTSSNLTDSSGAAIAIPTGAAVDAGNPVVNKTFSVPTNLQVGRLQVNGQDTANTDFQLRFYSDGRCDAGAISFTTGSNTNSLVIDGLGKVTTESGDIPDASTYRWEAGSFEPREGQ